MTALVTKNLHLLSAAPGGIARLRDLILRLAFRGKLVEQDPGDEPASKLLTKILEEKARLASSGEARQKRSVADGAIDGMPEVLPATWVWTALPTVYSSLPVRGNQILSSEIAEQGRFPVVDQGKRFVAGYTDKEDLLIRIPGPVVVFGDHTTERKYIDFDFVAGADGVKVLRPIHLNARFFWWQLVSLKLEGRGYARHFKVLNECSFALPPINEQARIVAKVDELMALCDRLEDEQADAGAAHAKLVEALLASLTQARDAADFRASWQQLAEHFHTLFTTDESLEALKGAVVQIGVMGRLVPQRADEGSAADELIRLASSPAMRAVKTKKAQETSDVDSPPFGIPSTWVWTRIGQIAASTEYGLSEKTSHSIEGVPVLKMGDIQRGKVLLETSARVPQGVEGLPELYLEPGDLLYNRTNSAELVGKTGLFLGPGGEYTFASYLIRVRFDAEFVSSRYINHVMNSPLFRETQINPHLKQQCGQANVNGTVMKNMLVSLPPLAEQHRIVAKVDELLGLCDQLKQNLATACQIHEHLASALVEQAVA